MTHRETLSRRTFLKVGGTIAGAAALAACAPVAAPADERCDRGKHRWRSASRSVMDAMIPRPGLPQPSIPSMKSIPTIEVSVEQIGEFHAKIPALGKLQGRCPT